MILTSWCSYKVRYILKSFVYTGALPAFKTLSTSLTRKSALINSPGLLIVCLVTMEPGNEQPSVVLAREFLGQRSSHLLIFSPPMSLMRHCWRPEGETCFLLWGQTRWRMRKCRNLGVSVELWVGRIHRGVEFLRLFSPALHFLWLTQMSVW